jgi:hypothetical protein
VTTGDTIQVPEQNWSGKYLSGVGAQILYSGKLGRSGTQVVSGYSVSDAQH